MLLTGNGPPQNLKIAYDRFRAAAEKDHPPSDFAVGFMRATGLGCVKDEKEASLSFQKAAREGVAEAAEFVSKDSANPAFHTECLDLLAKLQKDVAKEFAIEYEKLSSKKPDSSKILDYKSDLNSEASTENLAQPKITEDAPEKIIEFQKEQAKNLGFAEILELAEKGDPFLQNELGIIYFMGKLVPPNIPEALKWFTKAAEQGNIEAQMYAGHLCSGLYPETMDYEKSLYWHTKLAEKGDAEAQFQVGFHLFHGMGTPIDLPKSIEWCVKASDQGHLFAKLHLGGCYVMGSGVPKDHQMAEKFITEAAEGGLPLARLRLGLSYINAEFTKINKPMGIKWLTLAAEDGEKHAQFTLGMCYFHGNGVARDTDEAIKWNLKAAEQGFSDSLYFLSRVYELGEYAPIDMEKSIGFMTQAAEKGHLEAMFDVATRHFTGVMVPSDLEVCVKYFTILAEQGDRNSLMFLATLIRQQNYKPKNPEFARRSELVLNRPVFTPPFNF
jgi:TPR repeat protein